MKKKTRNKNGVWTNGTPPSTQNINFKKFRAPDLPSDATLLKILLVIIAAIIVAIYIPK